MAKVLPTVAQIDWNTTLPSGYVSRMVAFAVAKDMSNGGGDAALFGASADAAKAAHEADVRSIRENFGRFCRARASA